MEVERYIEDLVSDTYHTVHVVSLHPYCTWLSFYDRCHMLAWSDCPEGLAEHCYVTYSQRINGDISKEGFHCVRLQKTTDEQM